MKSAPPNTNPPDRKTESPFSGWALRVATVAGIPIRLHFTFLLLLAFIAVSRWGNGGWKQVLFVCGVFFCIVLHELGHALLAQRFGYVVRDIVLYPIGGVASIEETPKPRHELFIALAGPAVNVVIVALLSLYATLLTPVSAAARIAGFLPQAWTGYVATVDRGPLTLLMWSNLLLIGFNLIPAFPMDGGRVLRALLSLRIGQQNATRIAAGIGQAVAVLTVIAAVNWRGAHANFFLILIAVFVFFGAAQERSMEEGQAILDDAPMQDAMMRDFVTLRHGDTLKHAAEVLLAGSQQDFPVASGGEVVGMLSRSALLRGLAREGDTAFVALLMDRNVVFAAPDAPLQDYLLSADGLRRAPVLVRSAGGEPVVGMVTLENAMEFVTLRQIERSRVGR